MINQGRINKELQWELQRHKRIAELLAIDQARLQYLLKTGPAIIYSRKASDGCTLTFISENVSIQFGYEPWELIDEPQFWINQIHPQDREGVLKRLFQISEEDQLTDIYRFKHKNGDYHLVYDKLQLVRGNDGCPQEIIGCILDISERC